MMTDDASITIRPATAKDTDAVLACLAAAFTPYAAKYTGPAFDDTVLSPQTFGRRMRKMKVACR